MSQKDLQAKQIEAIAFVNNPISQRMLQAAMKAEGVLPSKTALYVLRSLEPNPWWNSFADVVRYPHKASLTLWGQRRFLGFYWDAARHLRKWLGSPSLRCIFVINNDNILTNHALAVANRLPRCRTAIVAEGLMNYQDIQLANRAWWRNLSRPIISRLLGLQWHTPQGHLSGAYEPGVDAVYSFANTGLFAPKELVQTIPFEPVVPTTEKKDCKVLFIETALWQWMSEEKFHRFADSFASWIRSLGCIDLIIKPHPNYPPSDYLRKLLPEYQIMDDRRSVEDMAADIDAARVVGFCCTGLITLAKLRPDIECIDFGNDFYLDYAYRGDRTLVELMADVGVTMVPFASTVQLKEPV